MRVALVLALAATANALSMKGVQSRRGLLGGALTGAASLAVGAPANAAADKNIALLKTLFDGTIPAEGVVAWYEANLAADFTASFAEGKLVLPRDAYVGTTKAILASVPDFTYTAPKKDFKKKKDAVSWTAVAKGTHTGAPYSPIPKVPAAKANKKSPRALQNDPEAVTVVFDKSGKIKSLSVAAIPGGKGFSGPVGFYLQMGGDPKKLPRL